MDGLEGWRTARDRVLVMGVINVTPDSFYDGGRWLDLDAAGRHALNMISDGADIVDVGGESSRPGSQPVPVGVEIDRVLPLVRWIVSRTDAPVSVDTTKAAVAEAALEAGARIINDISALRSDPRMASVIADHQATAILMHMQGTPETMQRDPRYADAVADVRRFLQRRIRVAVEAGIPEDRIIVDPGIGFGKRVEHNLALLTNLRALTALGAPVLVGCSRKSFLGAILDVEPASRLVGTVAANAVAIVHGAELIRVHDAREGRWTADVAYALRTAANGE
jgi:dihydropteroate synthase